MQKLFSIFTSSFLLVSSIGYINAEETMTPTLYQESNYEESESIESIEYDIEPIEDYNDYVYEEPSIEDLEIYYEYTPETEEEKLDAKKLELLYEIAPRLMNILSEKKESGMESLSNEELKTMYDYRVKAIMNNIEDSYIYGNYWYSGSGDYLLNDLKANINSLKEVLSEIEEFNKTGKNPYYIDEKSKNNIENNIIELQSQIIDSIIPEIEKFLENDIKETGDFDFMFENEELGRIEIIMEKYYSIMNILKFKQEIGLNGTIKLDIRTSTDYLYNEETGFFEEIPGGKLTGNINFDITLSSSNGEYYLEVVSLGFDLNSKDESVIKTINELKELSSRMVGKTIRFEIPEYYMEAISSEDVLEFVNLFGTVLKENSLVTPYKLINDNSYELVPSFTTMYEMGKMFGQELDEDDFMEGIMYEVTSPYYNPILYTTTDTGFKVYSKVDEIDAKGEIAIYHNNASSPMFLINVIEPNGLNKAYLKLTKDAMFVDIFVIDGYTGDKMSVEGQWLGGKVNMNIDFPNGNLLVDGDLSEELVDFNVMANVPELDITNEEVLSVYIKENRSYQYDYEINMNLDKTPMGFMMNLEGNSKTEFGSYEIYMPSNYINAEDIFEDLELNF